jgi:hypothetical protein
VPLAVTSAQSSEEAEVALVSLVAGQARAVATRVQAARCPVLIPDPTLALVMVVVVKLTAGAMVQQLGSLHGCAMMTKRLL